MGNPQHLEWLLEGVEAWNARREAEDFEPDLSGFDIYEAFKAAKKLNKNRQIPLVGINFSGADLKAAVIWQADLGYADLADTDIRGAVVGSPTIGSPDVDNLNFARTKVRTLVQLGSEANDGTSHEYTDLAAWTGLRQKQVDGMDGDTGTILPPGLTHPPHWPDPPNVQPSDTDNLKGRAEVRVVREKLTANREALILSSASLLQQIAEFRFQVYSNNQLASDHPELRDGLLKFLDRLSAEIEVLLQQVPASGAEATEQQAEAAASWVRRFTGSALPEWQKYLAPEALGKASAPGGIILGCGALGAILTGLNPLGFGAGAVVGKWITGEMKSGQASDKLRDMLEPEAPDS